MTLNWQESAPTVDFGLFYSEHNVFVQTVFSRDHLVCLTDKNTIYSLELFRIYGYPYSSNISGGGYAIPDFMIHSFATNTTQTSIVVAGYGSISPPQHLYRLADGDSAFSPLANSPLAIWKTVSSDSTGQYLVAGQSDTAYKQMYWSHDFGATWTLSTIENGLFLWNRLVCSQNGQYVFAGGDSAGQGTTVFVSNDYGVSFTVVRQGGLITDMSCDATGESIVVAVENEGVYQSSDYGLSWTLLTDLLIVKVAIDETGQKILGNTSTQTYFSSNAGATWESQNLQTSQNTNSNVVAISEFVYLSQNGFENDHFYLVELNSIASLPWTEINGGFTFQSCITNETGQHSIAVNYPPVSSSIITNTLFI